MNTPLGENGGMKIALRKLQSDSFMFNVTRDEREKARDFNQSVSIDFDPSEKLNVNFIFDNYNDIHNITFLLISQNFTLMP